MVFRGTYRNQAVAVKKLKLGSAASIAVANFSSSSHEDVGSDYGSGTSHKSSDSLMSHEDLEARLISFEEFRHEVWIMR